MVPYEQIGPFGASRKWVSEGFGRFLNSRHQKQELFSWNKWQNKPNNLYEMMLAEKRMLVYAMYGWLIELRQKTENFEG